MRRTLGTLAVLLILAGCGDQTSAGSPSPESPTQEVVLLTQTAGGGDVEDRATDVSDEDDLTAYVDQFDDPLAQQVVEAAARLEGSTVLAQVVYVGCGAPSSAQLKGEVIVPAKVDDADKECFAPVTTVALAATD